MKYTATVTRVVLEAPNISTIFFTARPELASDEDTGASPFTFTAGQYITVYFDQTGKKSGKAYSLSSAPGDAELSITVKKIGEFSGLLCELRPGDEFMISSAYGFFNVSDDLPIVAIAAGVGVSPIWSIIRSELLSATGRPISLFLTAPTQHELVFKSKIDELFNKISTAERKYFITRANDDQESASLPKDDSILSRRFKVSSDLSPDSIASSRFYLCGSESFVGSLWRQLMEAGVDESRVVTETFFESLA